MYEVYFVHWY